MQCHRAGDEAAISSKVASVVAGLSDDDASAEEYAAKETESEVVIVPEDFALAGADAEHAIKSVAEAKQSPLFADDTTPPATSGYV